MPILISIFTKLLLSLATEAVMKKVIIRLAESLVSETSTTVDDDIVKTIKEAWGA